MDRRERNLLLLISCLLLIGMTVQAFRWFSLSAYPVQYVSSFRAAIDPNTASADELQRLPGVGPVIAQRIIAFRSKTGPFEDADELTAVKGIGPKKLAKMKPYIALRRD